VTEASELLCKPFFLLLNPVQSVLAHWTLAGYQAPNESSADPFKPHWLEAYSVVWVDWQNGRELTNEGKESMPKAAAADPLQFLIKVLLRS
jgi:hypothetical protein